MRRAVAQVHRARKKAGGEEVAIKSIDKSVLKGTDVKMLASECAVLKQVSHPNCIRLTEIFSTPSKLVLVMELVTGGEMLDRMRGRETYTEKDAAQIVKKIAEGLAYLHSLGIAHRDLKPENLLLAGPGDDAVVKIADFGFAKIIEMDGDKQLETACGTPEYVAPEVLSCLPQGYGTSCDIWSFGVVVYVMLSGRPPFWSVSRSRPTQLHRSSFELCSSRTL